MGGVLLAAAWALAVEPRRLRVRRETVRLPDWPPELDGLRVAVVSDLHAGMPHAGPGRVARHGARYRAGLIEEGGRRLYVSAGVGTTGIPARLFAPPEIAVLELRPL